MWVHRLIVLNGIAAGATLFLFMLMFGTLTGSALAGLAFPLALPAMALGGDAWGIWILSSAALLALHLAKRRRQRRSSRTG